MVEKVGVVLCTNRALKIKEHLPFCREFSVICIEDSWLLLNMLSNFERERFLMTQPFDWQRV